MGANLNTDGDIISYWKNLKKSHYATFKALIQGTMLHGS